MQSARHQEEGEAVSGLNRRELAYLAARGIDKAGAAKRRLHHISKEDAKSTYNMAFEGLGIPFKTPSGQAVVDGGSPFERLRIIPGDGPFGAPKDMKFLQPPGM